MGIKTTHCSKEKNPHFFYYTDDDHLIKESKNSISNTEDAIVSVLLNMPKSRLKKLVSSKSSSYISAYSYWRKNPLINSSYGSNFIRYAVDKNELASIPKKKSIKDKKFFIQIVSSAFGKACGIKPKLHKWALKNADGLFLYYAMNKNFRYAGIDNDLVKILLRTKDGRVQKIAVNNMEVSKLKAFNKKYVSTEKVKLKSDTIYKIACRLRNQEYPDTFVSFINNYRDNVEKHIPWTYQMKVRSNLAHIVESLSQKEILDYSQTLIQMVDKELNYGSYYYLGNNCLYTMISYLKKEKALFLLNGIDHQGIRNQISNIISSEETQWDN